MKMFNYNQIWIRGRLTKNLGTIVLKSILVNLGWELINQAQRRHTEIGAHADSGGPELSPESERASAHDELLELQPDSYRHAPDN